MPRARADSKNSRISIAESTNVSEAPCVTEAPSPRSLSVSRTVETIHDTDSLSALAPGRSLRVDESALALRDIDFDAEGHLSEFLHIAEADKNWHRRKDRFNSNTDQLEMWNRRVERLQQESANEIANLQSRYKKNAYEIECGCPHVHIKSPFKGLHRRMKADLLGMSPQSSTDLRKNWVHRPSSAPPGRNWNAGLEHEFRRVRVDAAQRNRSMEFSKRTRWHRVATMELMSQKIENLPTPAPDQYDDLGREVIDKDRHTVFPKFHCTNLVRGLCSAELVQGDVVSEAEVRVTNLVLNAYAEQMKTIHDERNHYLRKVGNAKRQQEKESMERNLRAKEEDSMRKPNSLQTAARFCQILSQSINSRGRGKPGLQQSCQTRRYRENVNTRDLYTGGPLNQNRSRENFAPKRLRPGGHQKLNASLLIQRCWKKHKAKMLARRRLSRTEP